MVIKIFSIIMVLLSGTITELSAQNRSFVRFGQTVTVNEGQEVRDAVAIGGNVIVKGIVTGSAVSVGGSVILASSAVVNGDVVSVGGGIQEDAGSNVSGDIVEVGMPWKNMSTSTISPLTFDPASS
jgi:NDP-sugar pyrophosphorylase family protein